MRILLLVSCLLTPWCATAQSLAAPRPLEGERVRLHIHDSTSAVEGTVRRQTADSIEIRGFDRPRSDSVFAFRDLRRIEGASRRRSMWTAVAGAVVGLGAGTALGVVETRRGEAHCREQPNHDMCGLEALAIPIYMLGGSVIGAVGGVFVEFDHWETVWTAEP